jgi:hypothetical protein
MNIEELKRLSDEAKARPIKTIGVVKHDGKMAIVGEDIATTVVAIRSASISGYAWDAFTLGGDAVLQIEGNYWREVERKIIAMGYSPAIIDAPATEQQAEAA